MKTLLIAVLSAIMMMSGCASQKTLTDAVLQARSSGKEGVTRSYPIPTTQAWDIAKAVFRWEKVDDVEEHPTEHYLIAFTGLKMAAFGTVMGVWVEPLEQDSSRITVITRNRGNCCPFSNLTAKEFFKRFEQGLNIVKFGKVLPYVCP
jgi:hypothetical protein